MYECVFNSFNQTPKCVDKAEPVSAFFYLSVLVDNIKHIRYDIFLAKFWLFLFLKGGYSKDEETVIFKGEI